MSHTSHAGAVSVDERRATSKYPTWGHLRSGSAR
jgi:hypothetical protein